MKIAIQIQEKNSVKRVMFDNLDKAIDELKKLKQQIEVIDLKEVDGVWTYMKD